MLYGIVRSMKTSFAKWLRRAIEDKGETIDGFAAETGVHRNTVYFWLTGESKPAGRTRSAIARALGVTRDHVDQLLGDAHKTAAA
jgi:transcriptional regulator with XRE-family HTH domain